MTGYKKLRRWLYYQKMLLLMNFRAFTDSEASWMRIYMKNGELIKVWRRQLRQ